MLVAAVDRLDTLFRYSPPLQATTENEKKKTNFAFVLFRFYASLFPVLIPTRRRRRRRAGGKNKVRKQATHKNNSNNNKTPRRTPNRVTFRRFLFGFSSVRPQNGLKRRYRLISSERLCEWRENMRWNDCTRECCIRVNCVHVRAAKKRLKIVPHGRKSRRYRFWHVTRVYGCVPTSSTKASGLKNKPKSPPNY